jgi:hypothetical protein
MASCHFWGWGFCEAKPREIIHAGLPAGPAEWSFAARNSAKPKGCAFWFCNYPDVQRMSFLPHKNYCPMEHGATWEKQGTAKAEAVPARLPPAQGIEAE